MANTWPSIVLMAKKSNSLADCRLHLFLAIAAVIAACWPGSLVACPFCTALEPTLCQLREQAAVVALVEVEEQSPKLHTRARLHKALTGAERLRAVTSLAADLDVAASPGSLLLLFGSPAGQGDSQNRRAGSPGLSLHGRDGGGRGRRG